MKKGNPLQVILLLLLLVILPFGSWMYLRKGFDYQKEAMAELMNYGKLSPFVTKDVFNRTISSDDLKGKLTLLNYFSSENQSKERLSKLVTLHEQFDDSPGVIFLNIGQKPGAEETLSSDITILDSSQFYFIPTYGDSPLFLGDDILYPLFDSFSPGDSLKFNPIEATDLKDFPFYVLIDAKGIIRNYYPYDHPERIKRIVEHVALTMPKTIEPDPEVIRTER